MKLRRGPLEADDDSAPIDNDGLISSCANCLLLGSVPAASRNELKHRTTSSAVKGTPSLHVTPARNT